MRAGGLACSKGVSELGIKQIKIDVNEVTVGMFVSGLDRPWTQTPFPLQGFYIRDPEEIKELRAHCHHVFIDVIKGSSPIKARLKTLSKNAPIEEKFRRTAKGVKQKDVAPMRVRHGVYPTAVIPIQKEIDDARKLHQSVHSALRSVIEQLSSEQQQIPLAETKRVAGAMVDSVLRSPDAFTWLSRVRDKDEYTYNHAVRSAVLAILYGRHIGLSKDDLDVLALGVLMKDIGKTCLPRQLLENQNRSRTEQEAYEQFVLYGVEILRKLPDVKPRVTAVIKTHCERINGSGFPEHLRGNRIPLLGKIAGIVTFYDETTNPRGARPLSPSKAVAKLYELRDIEFQSDLVVEFIRAIGLYPTGTLVELNTGEVAVVVEQNFQRRLKPKVMIVLDAYKSSLSEPVFLDMAEDDRQKQQRVDAGKLHPSEMERVEIVQDLEPGIFEIDIAKVLDGYLAQLGRRKGTGLLKGGGKLVSIFGR